MRDFLKQHLASHGSEWVFPSQRRMGTRLITDESRPTNARNLCARIFDPAVKAAGLKGVTWHVLRHTFISRMVMQGVDLALVRELAGHKTMAMTLRYAHLAPGRLRTAIAQIDAFRDHPEQPLTAATGTETGTRTRSGAETRTGPGANSTSPLDF